MIFHVSFQTPKGVSNSIKVEGIPKPFRDRLLSWGPIIGAWGKTRKKNLGKN